MSATLRFIEALWPLGVPESCRLLLWRLADRRSTWHAELDDLAAQCAGADDIYIGVGAAPASGEYGARRRCPASEIAAIPGYWADIDAEGGLDIITAPYPTTVIVHSGYGHHCWWLFREPWIFADESDRSDAAIMAEGFQAHLRAEHHRRGVDMDATADLARILRVPGTMNCKRGDKREVRLISCDGPRYNPDDFEQFKAIYESTLTGEKIPKDLPQIVINNDASPPFGKFEALIENVDSFRLLWTASKDAEIKDRSPSGWDYGLACHAAGAGWSAQEICDLLVAGRHSRGDKIKRASYFARTIARACARAEGEQSKNLFVGIAHEADDKTLTDTPRQAIFEAAECVLGFAIQSVTCYDGDVPEYAIATPRGTIKFRGAKRLMNRGEFRAAVAEQCGVVIPSAKISDAGVWEGLLQALVHNADHVQAGAEVREETLIVLMVNDYMQHVAIVEHGEIKDLPSDYRGPVKTKDNIIFIDINDFRKVVRNTKSVIYTQRDCAVLFKKVGAAHKQIPIGRESARQWRWGFVEEAD